MVMKKEKLFHNLTRINEISPVHTLQPNDRFVIFSDLHIGDRSRLDEFVPNSKLFLHILSNYYRRHDYNLVLNGDIEELKRFALKTIIRAWPRLYDEFRDYSSRNRLFKLVGNHDNELISIRDVDFTTTLPGLKLSYRNDTVLIFHGHQASHLFTTYNEVLGFAMRYILTPLGIKNFSVSHSSSKKFRIERRVYRYSSEKKMLSIIGHTHRPLFESLSKVDSTKFNIENLCREYTNSDTTRRAIIEKRLDMHKKELARSRKQRPAHGSTRSLYNSDLLVPCVFNSGCVTGKRGITALEIDCEKIRLVHWFDRRKSNKHLRMVDQPTERLGNSDFYRSVLKQDCLQYIFNRINLLS